ncbi:MAG TPA: SpoIIE family protein phosphatase [Candidatus Micrarchaeaceae archaeon]|nr:SpoIIE family protein phosphatase [Candidatus Micrarchaeaceae archaeon]
MIELEDGALLVVVDALGHGPAAAEVAALALKTATRSARLGLTQVLATVDGELRGTRGVVAALARFWIRERKVSWASIGDVQGVIASPRGRTTLVERSGVLGFHGHKAAPTTVAMALTDVLCLATDGVAPDFREDIQPTLTLEAIASRLQARLLLTDDTLAVVARWNRSSNAALQ